MEIEELETVYSSVSIQPHNTLFPRQINRTETKAVKTKDLFFLD